MHQRSLVSKSILEEPTIDELSALTSECFPPIEESLIIITEYSKDALRISKFTLEEVLTSDNILQPGELVDRVRWIHVEYYKMGTFWGSDFRFAQWGTDPALFEKSPIVLLQKRLAELDRLAGRPSLEQEDIAGKCDRLIVRFAPKPLLTSLLSRLQTHWQVLSTDSRMSRISRVAC